MPSDKAFICAITVVGLLAGCHGESANPSATPHVAVAAGSNHVFSSIDEQKSVAPLRAAFLQDKTESSTQTRTPLVTLSLCRKTREKPCALNCRT
jgi:hypothetical protein